MERFKREDVMGVLARFRIFEASQPPSLDPTEEIFILSPSDFDSVDNREVTLALMDVLPHKKVWVVKRGGLWQGEPI
jgi:hypothetical protein